MATRLSSNCTNCTNLFTPLMREIHQVKVSESYTCDQFKIKEHLSLNSDSTSD